MDIKIDFFENGLCFYCNLATSELVDYKQFHTETEELWKQQDALLQRELDAIIKKYPQADHDEIIESHGWALHLNQYKFPDIHRTSLVIAIYVFIEDQLNGLCEILGTSMDTSLKLDDISGQGIERALTYMSKVAGFDTSVMSKIGYVKHVNRLRNKLVHAGGVLPENKEDKLNRFVLSEEGLRGEPGKRVRVDPSFIDALVENLIIFFEEVDSQVRVFINKNSSQTAQ